MFGGLAMLGSSVPYGALVGVAAVNALTTASHVAGSLASAYSYQPSAAQAVSGGIAPFGSVAPYGAPVGAAVIQAYTTAAHAAGQLSVAAGAKQANTSARHIAGSIGTVSASLTYNVATTARHVAGFIGGSVSSKSSQYVASHVSGFRSVGSVEKYGQTQADHVAGILTSAYPALASGVVTTASHVSGTTASATGYKSLSLSADHATRQSMSAESAKDVAFGASHLAGQLCRMTGGQYPAVTAAGRRMWRLSPYRRRAEVN